MTHLQVAEGNETWRRVQVLERKCDLRRVEARAPLAEPPELPQVREQLAARQVVKQKTERQWRAARAAVRLCPADRRAARSRARNAAALVP